MCYIIVIILDNTFKMGFLIGRSIYDELHFSTYENLSDSKIILL